MHFPVAENNISDRDLLLRFIDAYEQHIFTILGFARADGYELPTISPDLKEVLGERGRQEIANDFRKLRKAISDAKDIALKRHGLLGPQLRFKIAYLNSVEAKMYDGPNFQFTAQLGKSLGGIADTIIDSALEATGAGVGIKEIGDVASDVIGDTIDDK